MNLVFAGTPPFGLPCLEALVHSEHKVVAVYTQPDRPSGRGRHLQASPIKVYAQEQQIPVYQPLNFKNPEQIEVLAALKPDLMVVIAYGLILPASVLAIPRLGCINAHASLLPRWRGASPIQQAILHGDTQSGITLMRMDVGMDTGPMLHQEFCSLDPRETAGSLHDKLSLLSVEPLLTTLDALAQNKAQAQEQDPSLVTYASKIAKEDACVSWQDDAITIDRCIRAYHPWPIAYTLVNNEPMRIHQATVVAQNHLSQPGTILNMTPDGILVATGNQSVLIQRLQFPGGKILAVSEWLHAGKSQLSLGLVLHGHL